MTEVDYMMNLMIILIIVFYYHYLDVNKKIIIIIHSYKWNYKDTKNNSIMTDFK